MKYSIITNVDLGILIYFADRKGLIGKRNINKAEKVWNYVTAAMDKDHAEKLMAHLSATFTK